MCLFTWHWLTSPFYPSVWRHDQSSSWRILFRSQKYWRFSWNCRSWRLEITRKSWYAKRELDLNISKTVRHFHGWDFRECYFFCRRCWNYYLFNVMTVGFLRGRTEVVLIEVHDTSKTFHPRDNFFLSYFARSWKNLFSSFSIPKKKEAIQ